LVVEVLPFFVGRRSSLSWGSYQRKSIFQGGIVTVCGGWVWVWGITIHF